MRNWWPIRPYYASEDPFWMTVDGLTACCGQKWPNGDVCEGTIRREIWATGKCEFCGQLLRVIIWKRPEEFEDYEEPEVECSQA